MIDISKLLALPVLLYLLAPGFCSAECPPAAEILDYLATGESGDPLLGVHWR